MATNNPYYPQCYVGFALDPIHVGTGGYRLGRVDLSIVREPGTNIPKVPGTSLSGVARAYTALAYTTAHPNSKKYPNCAGRGGNQGENHCGEPQCPVCVAFGFAKGDQQQSFQGLAQFSDAQIVFFPVHSMVGPVWVTSQSVLEGLDVDDVETPENGQFWAGSEIDDVTRLNLGWLMVERAENDTSPLEDHDGTSGLLAKIPKTVLDRAVLVDDRLFETVINSNLEVRTSVSIDPSTGAAESGALFTYEAIPRATVLSFTVTYADPTHFKIGGTQAVALPQPPSDSLETVKNNDFSPQGNYLHAYVYDGLRLIEHLGVGGMATRGMGRMRISLGGQNGTDA